MPLLFYKFHIWTWWCTEHPCHNSTPVLSRSLHPYKECLGVLLNFYFLICLLSENNKKGFSFQREKLCMNKYASEESGRTKFPMSQASRVNHGSCEALAKDSTVPQESPAVHEMPHRGSCNGVGTRHG